MPWEAKRWFVFAGLMFAGSIWAVTYEPDNVQRRSIIETEAEADRPTVPLTRPGPTQPGTASAPPAASAQAASAAAPATADAGVPGPTP